ncbi:MAG: DUF2058 domain-containing protein [Pseudomonadales bacterium]|nr:DUF2058 domain-containing protein [Pseudomonadales bacterium]
MAGSLRDQLINAGLATAEQARKAERQVRADQQGQRKDKSRRKSASDAGAPATGKSSSTASAAENEAATAAAQARARARELNVEKARRDRALQESINAKAAERALRAEIRQIIVRNDQRTRPAEDDVPYNFLHGRKVKRIYVTPEHRAQLSSGRLVIVNDEGRYALVPDGVAEKIRARDPKRIIAAHTEKPAEPGDDDEYYARFKVPDDLDW